MKTAQKIFVVGMLTTSLSLGMLSASAASSPEQTDTTPAASLLTRKVNEYEGQHRKVNEYEGQHRKLNLHDLTRKVNEYEGQH